MTTSSNPSAGGLSGSADDRSDTKSTEKEDRKRFWILMIIIAPFVLIAAVVLLVGLPLGAVMIMNSSGCCLADSPEHAITFWASMVAGFLALFGMIITAVFIITAFRVDATARATARLEAQNEVWFYVKHYRKRLYKDLRSLHSLVGEVRVEVERLSEEAKLAFAEAQEDVETRQSEADSAILTAQEETTSAASQAREAIAGALNETTSAANEAQAAIGRAEQEVQRRRNDTIQAIEDARQEAEDAARTVRELAERAAEDPTRTEGDDPERRDE